MKGDADAHNPTDPGGYLRPAGGDRRSVAAQTEEVDPRAPAYFEVVEDQGDSIVASDPRMSGALIEGEFIEHEIEPGRITYAGSVRLENDEGAWQGWTSGFGWDNTPPWHEQAWYVGEGAYDGLSAVSVGQWCPEGDFRVYGIIYEGDVPPLWEPEAE